MDLNGMWTLYFAPEGEYSITDPACLAESGMARIPCTVPGNVELDLSAAGVLPEDLFKGENILAAEEFEHYEWWYETAFTAPESCGLDEEMILQFRAVDCFADYYLNGQPIGSSDNMFIAHEFDVTDKLRYGQANTLHVHLWSAVRKGPAYHPETHLWGPRDYFKSGFYKDSKAYFASETGYHVCPVRISIERFIDEDKVWPYFNNAQWNLHSSDQFDSDKRTMLLIRWELEDGTTHWNTYLCGMPGFDLEAYRRWLGKLPKDE